MYWRIIYKLVGMGVSIVLLLFIGITGFIYISEDYNAYVVMSDSMQPDMSSGDLVLVGSPGKPFVDDIKPGAIVTYRHNEALVTHRVVSITDDTLITKGDAMEDTDPWTVSRLNDVESGYITHIPYLGHLNAFIKTRTGWFLVVILPGIFLLTLIIKEILKEALRNEKYTKEVI